MHLRIGFACAHAISSGWAPAALSGASIQDSPLVWRRTDVFIGAVSVGTHVVRGGGAQASLSKVAP
uniref:Hypothethical protein n=1 Tax=Ralstonia syzygii R24 TaxID=907261 RepID=G3ACT7_9RALS|nr:hypothethical protein [Ralstonia syzygii R24]